MRKRVLDADSKAEGEEKVQSPTEPILDAEDLDVSSSESDSEPAADQEGGEYGSDESEDEITDEEEDDEEEKDETDAELYSSDDEIDKAVLDLVQGKEGGGSQPGEEHEDRQDRTADAGTSQAAGAESDSSDDERPNRNTGKQSTHANLFCTKLQL